MKKPNKPLQPTKRGPAPWLFSNVLPRAGRLSLVVTPIALQFSVELGTATH